MMAVEAIKVITAMVSRSSQKMLLFNLASMDLTRSQSNRDPGCPVCGALHDTEGGKV